jgi:hypothetical protein
MQVCGSSYAVCGSSYGGGPDQSLGLGPSRVQLCSSLPDRALDCEKPPFGNEPARWEKIPASCLVPHALSTVGPPTGAVPCEQIDGEEHYANNSRILMRSTGRKIEPMKLRYESPYAKGEPCLSLVVMILSVAPLCAQSPPASPNRPWHSPEARMLADEGKRYRRGASLLPSGNAYSLVLLCYKRNISL